jgi:hypothetical protein
MLKGPCACGAWHDGSEGEPVTRPSPRWRTDDEAALLAHEKLIGELRDELSAAHKRIENIIEVAGHLQPSDVRNAAFWIVSPPHLETPKPEEWEIEGRISQRNSEVDRVEKVITLCLEKHFGELRDRVRELEAEREVNLVRIQVLEDDRKLLVLTGFHMEGADIDG